MWYEWVLFMRRVSARSSALCPVTILSAFILTAPLSSACLRKTPQKVQLPFLPTSLTMSSIDQPYRSTYDTMYSSMPYSSLLRLTLWRLSSLYPLMPSSTERRKRSRPYPLSRLRRERT